MNPAPVLFDTPVCIIRLEMLSGPGIKVNRASHAVICVQKHFNLFRTDNAPSWKHFSVMHVHMLEPKSKLVDADDDEADADDSTTEDSQDVDSPDDATHPHHLAGITAHFLHGGGGVKAAAAAAAAGGGVAGIGELMQHADAMLRSDKAQLAAAHTAHAGDKDAVLAERCVRSAAKASEGDTIIRIIITTKNIK
jgi:hypothetical protein